MSHPTIYLIERMISLSLDIWKCVTNKIARKHAENQKLRSQYIF